MGLTGQAKESFEKWYKKTEHYKMFTLHNSESHIDIVFYELSDSMKYGVLVDWFLESIEIDIDESCTYYTEGLGKKKARIKTIQVWNEIYNQKN